MADAAHHAKSSAKLYGGEWQDYLHIHRWFDATKITWCDQRHRAILHSAFGVDLAIQVFGQVFKRASDGREVPVRWIGEQHVREDCGFIPSVQDWLGELPVKEWMVRGARTFVRKFQLAEEADAQQ